MTSPQSDSAVALASRMETLADSAVITRSVAAVAQSGMAGIRARLGPAPDSEAVLMMATHLAMALQRATDHVELDPIEVPASDLAQMNEGLAVADDLMAHCAELGTTLPEYERLLLALHITVIRPRATKGSGR